MAIADHAHLPVPSGFVAKYFASVERFPHVTTTRVYLDKVCINDRVSIIITNNSSGSLSIVGLSNVRQSIGRPHLVAGYGMDPSQNNGVSAMAIYFASNSRSSFRDTINTTSMKRKVFRDQDSARPAKLARIAKTDNSEHPARATEANIDQGTTKHPSKFRATVLLAKPTTAAQASNATISAATPAQPQAQPAAKLLAKPSHQSTHKAKHHTTQSNWRCKVNSGKYHLPTDILTLLQLPDSITFPYSLPADVHLDGSLISTNSLHLRILQTKQSANSDRYRYRLSGLGPLISSLGCTNSPLLQHVALASSGHMIVQLETSSDKQQDETKMNSTQPAQPASSPPDAQHHTAQDDDDDGMVQLLLSFSGSKSKQSMQPSKSHTKTSEHSSSKLDLLCSAAALASSSSPARAAPSSAPTPVTALNIKPHNGAYYFNSRTLAELFDTSCTTFPHECPAHITLDGQPLQPTARVAVVRYSKGQYVRGATRALPKEVQRTAVLLSMGWGADGKVLLLEMRSQ